MNGRQVADMARVFRPALKVLFITGYADKSVLGPGTLDPGMRVLTKPFTIDSLTAEIQEVFASEG
jgi:DNA-binding LytR/AlgR family response regulator